ncbi:glycosyltransferase [Nonomuraea sp. MCN248]|uniref:Glycosyltransferase n=1 Tax=Nonomuraea corallina TaxID=2989783 RepID=A0ABT4SFF8_9ACTN|nr:macrolide family glycosyltransferase [Nonomuraea corallina]MDA0635763.1 glycosyltransferase [Nonomuraea corallina]
MAHIAVFNPPAAGHVNPCHGVVQELVRRGHRVSYPGTTTYAEQIKETGADYVEYLSTWQVSGPKKLPNLRGRQFVTMLSLLLAETKAVYPVLLDRFTGDEPDLVLVDGAMGWWGRALGLKWDVPIVELWPVFASNDKWAMNQKYTRFSPVNPRFLLSIVRLASWLRQQGIEVDLRDFTYGSCARMRLVMIPKFFHYAGDTFDDSYHFVGPCFDNHAREGGWVRPASASKVVLLTLGTIYQSESVFRTCLEALDDPSWHVVVAGVKPGAVPVPTPRNVEVHTFLPRLGDVLAHADLLVSHGGMGTTLEALRHEVPSIALPQMAEQEANSDRIAELGLGVKLAPAEVTPDRLREAARAVMADAGIRAELRRRGAETRGCGGSPAAADAVESLLTR